MDILKLLFIALSCIALVGFMRMQGIGVVSFVSMGRNRAFNRDETTAVLILMLILNLSLWYREPSFYKTAALSFWFWLGQLLLIIWAYWKRDGLNFLKKTVFSSLVITVFFGFLSSFIFPKIRAQAEEAALARENTLAERRRAFTAECQLKEASSKKESDLIAWPDRPVKLTILPGWKFVRSANERELVIDSVLGTESNTYEHYPKPGVDSVPIHITLYQNFCDRPANL